jgi:hypothetical protein
LRSCRWKGARLLIGPTTQSTPNAKLPLLDAAGRDEPSPDTAARTRTALATYGPVFQLVTEARVLPAEPWSTESPERRGANLAPLLRLLSFRTRSFARLGEPDAAAAALLDEADLVRVVAAHRPSFASMPFFMGSSVILAQVGSDLGSVLEGGPLPQDALRPLSEALSSDPPDDLPLMLFTQLQMILRSTPRDRRDPITDGLIPRLAQRAAWPAERARVSDLLEDRLNTLEVLSGSAPDWPARLQRAEQAAAHAPHAGNSTLRSVDVMTSGSANRVAIVRAARAAVAIERYRLRRGEIPTRLADLVPDELDAVPADPFDGQPLRYRTDGAVLAIYSVGRNRSDDGGEVEGFGAPGFSHSYAPDVGIRLPAR